MKGKVLDRNKINEIMNASIFAYEEIAFLRPNSFSIKAICSTIETLEKNRDQLREIANEFSKNNPHTPHDYFNRLFSIFVDLLQLTDKKREEYNLYCHLRHLNYRTS